MVLRYLLGFSLLICLISCEKEIEKKGNEIPPVNLYKNPVDWERQIIYLNSILEENRQPQWLFYRARAYFNTHQYHLAAIDLEELFENASETNEEYFKLSALVNLRLGNLEKAKDAMSLFNGASLNAAENLPLLFEYHLALNHKKEAQEIFEKMLQFRKNEQKDADFFTINKGLIARDTNRIAGWLAQKKQIDYTNDFVAKTYLNYALWRASPLSFQSNCLALLKLYPRDAIYVNAWGKFLFRMNKVDMAEKVLKQSVALMPENGNLLFDLGKFYFDFKNYPQAILLFDKIAKEQTSYGQGQYYKTLSFFYSGQKDLAVRYMDSLVVKKYVSSNWSNRFYQMVRVRTDSSVVNSDSLTNLNQ